MRMAILVFLFLERICLPKSEPSPCIIWRRYGDKVLREVRLFEKLDHKLQKVQLGLDFLFKFKDSDVLPKFLNIRLAKKKLQDSLRYKNYQSNLLITHINLKKSHLTILKKEFYLLHSELKSVLNCIGFAHFWSLFLSSNDVILNGDLDFIKTKIKDAALDLFSFL